MLQNPHRQPDIHPGAEGGGPESAGALRDTGLATAPAGGDPTTSRQMSHVISPRSLFEIVRKRCNSNDVDSTFELIAGELRATLMGGGRAWPSFETPRRRGLAAQARVGRDADKRRKASPTETGQGHGRPAPRRRLLPMRQTSHR